MFILNEKCCLEHTGVLNQLIPEAKKRKGNFTIFFMIDLVKRREENHFREADCTVGRRLGGGCRAENQQIAAGQ